MKYFAMMLILVVSLQTSALEIKNFKSGLVCTDGKTFGWVCHEVKKIYITGQGSCVFNNQPTPCTWYGFSFDYKNMTKESKITCTSSSSDKVAIGNPRNKLHDNVNKSEYTLPVELGDGHFFNPQYTSLHTKNKPPFSNFVHTVCSSEGKVLFEIDNEIVLPQQQ